MFYFILFLFFASDLIRFVAFFVLFCSFLAKGASHPKRRSTGHYELQCFWGLASVYAKNDGIYTMTVVTASVSNASNTLFLQHGGVIITIYTSRKKRKTKHSCVSWVIRRDTL
jgi:hypothetical protein